MFHGRAMNFSFNKFPAFQLGATSFARNNRAASSNIHGNCGLARLNMGLPRTDSWHVKEKRRQEDVVDAGSTTSGRVTNIGRHR